MKDIVPFALIIVTSENLYLIQKFISEEKDSEIRCSFILRFVK